MTSELNQFLEENSDWAVSDGHLCKTFDTRSFVEALKFVQQVGLEAEKVQHHPDIDIRWKRVTLKLVTHDAGNEITEKDISMASMCEKISRTYV